MDKIKVLCVVREVLPYPGGYSIRGENIFHELSKYFDTYVAVCNYNNSDYYNLNCFKRDSVNFYISKTKSFLAKNRIANIPGTGIVIRYLKRYDFYINLIKYARIINPDIIIAHTPSDIALTAMRLSTKLKKPFILDVRQFNFIKKSKTIRGLYEKMIMKKIIENSNGFSLISKGTEKILKSFFKKNDFLLSAHIPNGISKTFIEKAEGTLLSEKKLSLLRQQYNIKGHVIGYIGTISDYEGLDLLIDAYLNIRIKNSSLLIIGDGPYFKKLQNKVESIRKEDIKIIGRVPYDDIFYFYNLIDIFVLPRISTPITESVTPIKPFEIMYAKKPIICSSVGGLTEIIADGKNGIVFEADNKQHLEKCLKDTIDNKINIDNIVDSAFRDIYEKYRWEIIGKKYMELIFKVLKKYNSNQYPFNEMANTTNSSIA